MQDDIGSNLKSFDVPMRELGFAGSVFKEMTLIMPCSDCLIAVTDKPPFVASVSDIEHVHFERVLFGGKNFDMVIIYKVCQTSRTCTLSTLLLQLRYPTTTSIL